MKFAVQAPHGADHCRTVAGCTLHRHHAGDCIVRNADGTGRTVHRPHRGAEVTPEHIDGALKAAAAGRTRAKAELAAHTQTIRDLLPAARAAGRSAAHVKELTGLCRQTLYDLGWGSGLTPTAAGAEAFSAALESANSQRPDRGSPRAE